MNHVCDDHCSNRATAASLGLPPLRRDYTVSDRIRHEQAFGKARHDAVMAGRLRLCTRTSANSKDA